MTIEEHNQIVSDILANAGDETKLMGLLDTLRDDYTQTLTNVENLTSEQTKILEENKSMAELNKKLFLKVSDVSDIYGTKKPKEKEIPEEPELKFEDLINDKGELI